MSKKELTREEILKLAKLANLTLTEDEIIMCKTQLAEIIGYVDKLNSVNTDDIKPVEQLTELKNVTRDDEPSNTQSLSQDQAVKNAKTKKSGYIRVEAIFDN